MGAVLENCLPVSLVMTSLSVSFFTGAFSFSSSMNLKSLAKTSSLPDGLVGATAVADTPVLVTFFCTP